jgi:hypothetical protein
MQKHTALDLFIPEIFELISTYLTQFDIISLSKACKSLNRLATCILYKSVTIDCDFDQFEIEYMLKNTTFIKTTSNFVSFTKSLIENSNPILLWPLIKNFQVNNLPLDFYDFESFILGRNDQNTESFLLKSKLNVLCLDSTVSFNLLEQILCSNYLRETLNVLTININTPATTKSLDDIVKNKIFKFQNLTTLSVGPCKQNFNLENILDLIESEATYKLENLKLEFQHKTFKLLDLLNISETKLISHHSIFTSLNNFQNLKRLALSSINFDQTAIINDLNFFQNFRFFENLIYLELTDIGIISSNPNQSILHSFYKNNEICNLKYIKLDIRSTCDDLIPNFFNDKIKDNQILEFDIIIRYNNMHILSLDNLIDEYIKIILRQKSSLQKLSIEVKSEKNLLNVEEQLQKEHLFQLLSYKFSELESLRLQVHFNNVLLFKNMLFKNMPVLKNFWIVGSNAVPVHFGLGNMYPGIHDKWWRILCLPKSLLNGVNKHPLKYIKIDECLFIINPNEVENIQPKTHIDRLFNNMTRVSFKNIIYK